MNIEVGKFYKTRGGHKVRIYATDGIRCLSIHGAVLKAGGWYIASWGAEGKYHEVGISDHDIISEWTDPPIIDWSAMPKWMNYAAMDEDKTWWLYSGKPYNNGKVNKWTFNEVDDAISIPKEYYPQYNGPWEESLVARPEVME